MRKSLVTAVTLVTVVAAFAACSSKKPNPPVSPVVTPDAGAEPVEAGAPEEAGVAVVEDAGPPFFTGGDAGAPPAIGEAALDSAIDLAVTTAATKLAPKMEKEGAAGRATLKEGEHFGMMITLAPNRCYTIIGNSPPGSVEKMDVKLYGPPLYNVEAGKSGANDKNMPVIGKGTTALCPILPIAVPYKLDVAATKGAGRIGVHVFARNK
ncbi:MAG: hypothetical protein KF764_27055 [Labilithrix sp.]|nr:hypothetical protein [Labilithrix sp.]